MGSLSDKWGRKPLYIAGTAGMILFAFPYFMLLSTGSNLWMTAASVLGLGVIWAPITAVLGTLMSGVFRTNVRYTGVTIGYQLGAALAGGTAPFIATALLARFNNAWQPVALYMILTAVISLVAILALRETKETELHDCRRISLCTFPGNPLETGGLPFLSITRGTEGDSPCWPCRNEKSDALYSMKDCLKDVEEAFRAHQEGKTDTPVRIALSAGTGEAATLYMPSFVEPADSMGIKIVSVFPDNPQRGRPAIQGITLLTDAETGEHLAVMDATYLTVLRTGAISGVAAKHLARKDARVCALLGAGAQAVGQIQAVMEVRDLAEIRLWNRTREKAERLVTAIREACPDWAGNHFGLRPAGRSPPGSGYHPVRHPVDTAAL